MPETTDVLDAFSRPCIVSIAVEGTTPFLFHRWPKNMRFEKSEDLEDYVYRGADGKLAIPLEYFRHSIISAAKFHQDPRFPRRSATGLFKAGILCLEELAGLGVDTWDYVEVRRIYLPVGIS